MTGEGRALYSTATATAPTRFPRCGRSPGGRPHGRLRNRATDYVRKFDVLVCTAWLDRGAKRERGRTRRAPRSRRPGLSRSTRAASRTSGSSPRSAPPARGACLSRRTRPTMITARRLHQWCNTIKSVRPPLGFWGRKCAHQARPAVVDESRRYQRRLLLVRSVRGPLLPPPPPFLLPLA